MSSNMHFIPFNKPPVTGNELKYISQAVSGDKLSGDGPFAKQCEVWLEKHTQTKKLYSHLLALMHSSLLLY